ncbi:hypothetical protein METBIDRAFT_35699 [Metschnikowia bicuspidata var. bicuspidata NRRL YB-4993]|uniref:Peroxisome assembly protein 22 n=1 Tax=Metschnikowia bicuspidata var. bicuspidata NRRL YB-4993 TaxID=869754 RepID=A0A1A0HIJ7_9ASCO|nr:hypothetical protein METBIDRAFT_35699 [Metschnikowia bicuspidata var. bicuspidata NRRL YB-4993]OBA23826.1 hypothetical protein METBIDRAFT_35699 [Metschnikowia bicuspidata var. bicuspidata NRRL YB-4993]
MARKKSPRMLAAILVASSVAAISYKLYGVLKGQSDSKSPLDAKDGGVALSRRRQYRNKSITVTLLHSVLNLGLPLNEMLLSSENVTFILPPYLSVDDLACQIESSENGALYELPLTLIRNYKLLKCSNIDGYFHLLKDLRPDVLFVCTDDLGIDRVPPDLRRFVSEIVAIEQDKENVRSVLSDVFLQ